MLTRCRSFLVSKFFGVYYIYNGGFWAVVPPPHSPPLWSPTARHNLKTFPPAQTPHISSPQPQSTLTINEITNEIINEITNDKKNTVNITCTCQKWNHDVKNETTMSKLCQTCQKSSTNPQRVNFHFVKIHAAFCLHQWKWSVRFGPLMTSMKTDFVTKIFYEWQILSPKNFDTLSTSISKNNANLFLI